MLNITPTQLADLQAHLADYQLGELAALLTEETTADAAGMVDIGAVFLNAAGQLRAQLLKPTAASPDFVFWIAADTSAQPLGASLPQMLPDAADAEALAFPQLGAVALSAPKWQYVYISDPHQWAALAPQPVQTLLATLGIEPTSAAGWRGGLYYSGQYEVPLAQLLPEGSAWLVAKTPAVGSGGVAVAGYLDYPSQYALPSVRLRIPLVEQTFDSVIKRIAFALELAAPVYYLNGVPAAQDRRIGLSGTLSFGSSALAVTGTWPLNNDQVLLRVVCHAQDVKAWLDADFLQDVPLPANAQVSLQLTVSTKAWLLKKVSFAVVLESWAILRPDFTLANVQLAVSVAYPASLALTLASFQAEATLGHGDTAVKLRCSGTYPDNDFYLGLAEAVGIQEFITAAGGPNLAFFEAGLAVSELSGRYNRSTGYKAFALVVSQPSRAQAQGMAGFVLENISLNMYGPTAGRYIFKLSAAFSYTYTSGNESKKLAFTGVAEHQGGWLFSLRYTGRLSLAELGKAFGFGDPPTELTAFVFTELSLLINGPASAADSWEYSFAGSCELPDLLGLQQVVVSLLVEKTGSGPHFVGSFDATFGGRQVSFSLEKTGGDNSAMALKLLFPVGGVWVDLVAETSTTTSGTKKLTDKTFTGSTQGLNLPVSDLLRELMQDELVPIPKALLPDLVLEDVYVKYADNELNIIALAAIDGHEVSFFLQRQAVKGKAPQYVYGITTEFNELSGLPLIGNELKAIKLQNLGFVHVSGSSDEQLYQLPTLSAAPAAAPAPGEVTPPRTLSLAPSETYEAGFHLLGKLVGLPTGEQPLALQLPRLSAPASSSSTSLSPGANSSVPPVAVVAPEVALATPATWFELNKQLGPLYLGRVGLSYADEKLFLLLSLDLDLAGLVFSLDGLGVGLHVKELLAGRLSTPDFKLSGLGLEFSSAGMELSASFLRSQQAVKDPDTEEVSLVDVYSGAALIKFGEITITGIGSYAKYKNQPSLFVYALYEGVLGGPPFLVVTGLSVGFGYNRRVNIPTYDAVARFPLVSMAMQPPAQRKLSDILHELETPDAHTGQLPIEIASGEYWLAAGVKFTSFEVVHGYLLLVASFGQRTQFAVLGVAEMSLPMVPPGAPAELNPFVYLEMQMAAVLVPSEGYFSVAGSLTPTSFVLTKECHLTGGFAYSMWYDSPDRTKQGQFVMTAGGYHPAFAAPAYYPQVPRLGYIWQVSNYVSIKGQSYFAITPACGMAGTSLEVNFDAGDLKAWFIARADLLVTWHPLSFVAEVYVEIGASVRLNLYVCHKTVTVSISGNLTLWGSPLGGRVSVHVIIVTLTISFGVDQPRDTNRDELDWPKFRQLLPAADKLCKIVVTNGLTQTMQDATSGADLWVVRGGSFSFSVQSAVPATCLMYDGASLPDGQTTPPPNKEVNIRGMNARAERVEKDGKVKQEVSSVLTLKLSEWNFQKADWQPMPWKDVFGSNAATPLTDNVPAALWGEPLSDGQGFMQAPPLPSSEEMVIYNQLLGCRVQAPAPVKGGSFGVIQPEELASEEVATGDLSFGFKPATDLPDYWLTSPAAAAPPIGNATGPRTGLWNTLSRTQLYTGANDDLGALKNDYANLFRDNPMQYAKPALYGLRSALPGMPPLPPTRWGPPR